MKKFIFLVFMAVSGMVIMAQEPDSSGFFEDEYMDEGQEMPITTTGGQGLKPYWHLSLGSSFGHISGIGNFTGFYAAPILTFPVNNRLSLQGGVIASLNYQPGILFPGENNTLHNFTSFSLYGSATYQLTDNLIIYGSGMKTLTNLPAPPAFMPLYPADNFTIGSSLKLGEHLTIGASFSRSDRYQPFGPYTLGFNRGMNSPFYNPDMFW